MAMYSALRDAFNDMNNMFIDRQNWQAEHKRRAEEDAHRRNQEERAMRRQEMQNEITAVQVAKARDLITPRDFSVYSLGDPNHIRQIMSDPKARDMMTKAIDDEGIGYEFSEADGGWVAPNGSRLQMSKLQAQNRAMAFYGIIDMHDRAPEAVQLNLLDLRAKQKLLKAERKKYSGLPGDKGRLKLGEIDTQLSAINSEITRSKQFLDPSTGEMFKYYTNKSQRMRKRALWAQSVGADELAGEFSKSSASLASNAALAMKAMVEKPTKTGTKEVTYYATRDGVINPITKKPMKMNESFKKHVPVGAEGAVMSLPDFSTTRMDVKTPKGGGGTGAASVLANNRAVHEAGKKVLEKISMPNGQIIPNTEKNTRLYKAVQRMYNKDWKETTKGMKGAYPEYLGDEVAARVINNALVFHERGKAIIDALAAGKWDGEDLTSADRKVMQKDLKKIINELKYRPDFVLRLGNENDELQKAE